MKIRLCFAPAEATSTERRTRWSWSHLLPFWSLLTLALLGLPSSAATSLVSGANTPNTPSNGASGFGRSSISADGTKVVFVSSASNLVSGDTNGVDDIFVRDLNTGITKRVSVDSSGTEANGASSNPVVSSDGSRVAFQSSASNLVSGDTNGCDDVFVYDLGSGLTTRASLDSNGTQGDGTSIGPSLNANGTKVGFVSVAGNLVSADTNSCQDVFVHDLNSGITIRASLNSNGQEGNSPSVIPVLSADGNKIAFASLANNLVVGDTNGHTDIFVRDLSTGITLRANVSTNGNQSNAHSDEPSLSADGTKVSFQSGANNLVSGDTNNVTDVFVRDLMTGITTRASVDSDGVDFKQASSTPSLSGDGSKITFYANIQNLVTGDTNGVEDIFVRDLNTGITTRVSLGSNDAETNGPSYNSSLSADGSKVVFISGATNLVSGDTNGFYDVFVSDVVFPPTMNVNDCQVTEGNSGTTNAVFTVTLSQASTRNVSVQYGVLELGVDSDDYGDPSDSDGGTPGTLHIPAGQTSGTITVPIKGDRVVEVSEGFMLILGGATGAVLRDSQGLCDIINDDNHAPTDITLSNNKIAENAGSNVFVGVIAGTDVDEGDFLDLSLPDGLNDNALFSLTEHQLRALNSFDYETKNSYVVTVRATDLSGNTLDKQFTIWVTETTKPTVTISTPAPNAKVQLAKFIAGALSGGATDNVGVAQVRVRLSRKRGNINQYWNGTDFVAGQTTVTANVTGTTNAAWTLSTRVPPVSKLDTGLYAVQVSAYDAAGNRSGYAERSFTLMQDSQVPTLTLTAPTANARMLVADFIAGAAQGTASDDQALAAVKVRLSRKNGATTLYWNGLDFVTTQATVDADLKGNLNATWKLLNKVPPTEKLTAGDYAIAVYALDSVGNKSATISASFTLGTDFLAPNVIINTPSANTGVNINSFAAGTLSGTASDNTGVVSVKLKLQRKRGTVTQYWNGTSFSEPLATVDATYNSESGTWSYDSAIPASALDAGGYTLYATAFDAAGNKTTSASRSFSIVGTPSATGAVSVADKSAGRS